MRVVVAAAVALVLLAAGCTIGSWGSSVGAEGASTRAEVAEPAPVPPPCGARAFLPVLKETFDDQAPKLRIVRADVERCRNGYAQVFAVPDQSVCDPGVGYCYETEQVFFRWTGGVWRIAFTGTGISCEGGSETRPVIVRACRALGYPA